MLATTTRARTVNEQRKAVTGLAVTSTTHDEKPLPNSNLSSLHLTGHGGRDTFQEAFELFRAGWMLEFSNGFGFDLPNPFAGDFKDTANFFQGIRIAVA
jgi:hypothetical protein